MHEYPFPIISNIDVVLNCIKDKPEFKVVDKGDYVVINYVVVGPDTFPDIIMHDEKACLLRECRGLIFNKSGKLIRRAYHKFFNLGERCETNRQVIGFNPDSFSVLEKLDGSMVTPLHIGSACRWATKMGITDTSMNAEIFVARNNQYEKFGRYCILMGHTPIFEWCSNKNRIVVNHTEDRLVLTAIRNNLSGSYLPYEQMRQLSQEYNIDCVDLLDMRSHDLESMERVSKQMIGQEGYVIRSQTGHMFKMKSDWYLAIHRAKESICHEKNLIKLIFEDQMDDVYDCLPEADQCELRTFHKCVVAGFLAFATQMEKQLAEFKNQYQTKKEFALELAPKLPNYKKSIVFGCWDNGDVIKFAKQLILRGCTSQARLDEVRPMWGGTRWNYGAATF